MAANLRIIAINEVDAATLTASPAMVATLASSIIVGINGCAGDAHPENAHVRV